MILEQTGEPLAGAARVAREHDLAAAPAKRADVLGDGLVDVGLLRALGREVARRLDAEVDDPVGFRLGEGRGEVDGPLATGSAIPSFGKIERVAVRAAGSCRARLPSPERGSGNNRRSPRAGLQRLVGSGVAEDQVVLAEMVEQGREPLFEQRQPMLHARHSASLGQRLVERVLGRGGAELLAIARAEALDAVGVEQGFATPASG